MSLILPTIGQEQAPTWGLDQQASMLLIDQHNHASGNGVQIQPNGLNISSDLTFIGNNAIGLRSVRFNAQGSPLSLAGDLNCAYTSGVDLYYNDGNGNQVRITQSGGVAGTSGSIGGLVSPATATYVAGTPAFVFQSAANTPANLDGGFLTIRNITANSKGITLLPPNALAADYSVTFPATLPGATNIVRLDSSGNLSATLNVDNTTIDISSNNLEVKAAGIGTTQLANASVTNAKLAALNDALSASCGTFTTASTTFVNITNLSASITGVGRPIRIVMIPDGGTSSQLVTPANEGITIRILKDAVSGIGQYVTTNPGAAQFSSGVPLEWIDHAPTVGSHSYNAQAACLNGGTVEVVSYKLYIYEL